MCWKGLYELELRQHGNHQHNYHKHVLTSIFLQSPMTVAWTSSMRTTRSCSPVSVARVRPRVIFPVSVSRSSRSPVSVSPLSGRRRRRSPALKQLDAFCSKSKMQRPGALECGNGAGRKARLISALISWDIFFLGSPPAGFRPECGGSAYLRIKHDWYNLQKDYGAMTFLSLSLVSDLAVYCHLVPWSLLELSDPDAK